MGVLPSQTALFFAVTKQDLVLNECIFNSGLWSIYVRIIWGVSCSVDAWAQTRAN